MFVLPCANIFNFSYETLKIAPNIKIFQSIFLLFLFGKMTNIVFASLKYN